MSWQELKRNFSYRNQADPLDSAFVLPSMEIAGSRFRFLKANHSTIISAENFS